MPGPATPGRCWGGRPVARTVADCGPRQRAVLAGHLRAVHSRRHPQLCFEAELADGTGTIALRFLGRDLVPGLAVGTELWVAGTVGLHHGRLCLLNPGYELRAGR